MCQSANSVCPFGTLLAYPWASGAKLLAHVNIIYINNNINKKTTNYEHQTIS